MEARAINMEEEILGSNFMSRFLRCWLLLWMCLLLPLYYYFRHRFSKIALFHWLVLGNKLITKLKVSQLYSLTTILRWKTELDMREAKQHTALLWSFTWSFPNSHSSSFQSLHWRWVTRMSCSTTRWTIHPAQPPRAVGRGSFLQWKVIRSFWQNVSVILEIAGRNIWTHRVILDWALLISWQEDSCNVMEHYTAIVKNVPNPIRSTYEDVSMTYCEIKQA